MGSVDYEKGVNVARQAARLVPYLVIAAFAVAVYWNTASYGFLFDDLPGILNNPQIATFRRLSQAAAFLKQPWRPVTQLSYALTIYLAGPDPRVFHITNILIHLVNSILVYAIARMAAGRWMPKDEVPLFGLAAGLIHAVHPLYTEAVSYTWGRSSSLCATFYFSSILLTIMGSERRGSQRYRWYLLAVASGLLAWWTKEEAITLAFVVAAFFVLIGRRHAAAAVALVPIALAAWRWHDILRLYAQVQQNGALVLAGEHPSLDPASYFLTHTTASVFYYLRIFVLPINQSVNPYVRTVARPADPQFLISLVLLLSLFALAIWASKSWPVLAFGLLALLISPLIAYSFMPLADVIAEHRVYLSGLGFDLIAAWLLLRLRGNGAALAVVALVLGLLTYHRNLVWADDLALWSDAERKSPELARPHLNLGLAYQAMGRSEAALTEYRHALAVNPRLALAQVDMAGVYLSRNDLERAEQALQTAVKLSPLLSEPYMDLAVVALRRGQKTQALEWIEKAAALKDSYLVHLNKGDVLSAMGRYTEAAQEYKRALDLLPDLGNLRQQVDTRLQHLRTMGLIPPVPHAPIQ